MAEPLITIGVEDFNEFVGAVRLLHAGLRDTMEGDGDLLGNGELAFLIGFVGGCADRFADEFHVPPMSVTYALGRS